MSVRRSHRGASHTTYLAGLLEEDAPSSLRAALNHVDGADHTTYLAALEEASAALPEEALTALIQEASCALPEETFVALPEEAFVALPKEAFVALPKEALPALPEETLAKTPSKQCIHFFLSLLYPFGHAVLVLLLSVPDRNISKDTSRDNI
ncbi:hypothetical protein PG990_009070 [Apiospora arundinis]